MKHEDFIHVLQAVASIVDDELVIVGSQAILGTVPDAPVDLLRSSELDVYPRSNPDRAIEIDGAMGDGSRFHELYGYYAHGVGPETVTAPAGWEDRLERLEVPAIRRGNGRVVGWCLSLHDLMLAKLAAGRPHDVSFVETALATGLVSSEELRRGIDLMPRAVRGDVGERLEGLAAKLERLGGSSSVE